MVNHKRVLRLMQQDNLLVLRSRPFVPVTTNSLHEWRVVPNLARGLVPTGLDQLWVADITYVRLLEEFAFLAVLLDAFSRRVIGWAFDKHLRASLAIAALEMAIKARRPTPASVIHHSDRGVQYACQEYTQLLAVHDIRASMSRIGNPYDNAKAESFMKTLKQEEVDGRNYRDLNDARKAIGVFIEDVYNRQRLHSALAYRPPAEFEASLPPRGAVVEQPRAASHRNLSLIIVSHYRGAVHHVFRGALAGAANSSNSHRSEFPTAAALKTCEDGRDFCEASLAPGMTIKKTRKSRSLSRRPIL